MRRDGAALPFPALPSCFKRKRSSFLLDSVHRSLGSPTLDCMRETQQTQMGTAGELALRQRRASWRKCCFSAREGRMVPGTGQGW